MGTHRSYRERKYEFGKRILAFRARTSLTQQELAEQIGVHRRSVQNWETGESYPKTDTLQRLIAVFLTHNGFSPGHERDEAQLLWNQAAQDGPHLLAAFDENWFAHILAAHFALTKGTVQPTESPPADRPPWAAHVPPPPENTRKLTDWGEAIAVPTLYGRQQETETVLQWIVDDHCRVVTIVGLGGMGKSSLAITIAHRIVPQFDRVLFRSLQNGPPLHELLDQIIYALAGHRVVHSNDVPDKIALLVQLFREQRCLLILDNLEAILQPGALTGTYRTGYAEYGALLQGLSEREHRSCLLLTSREKPAELGPLEGRTAPVRTLNLSGLDDAACQLLLDAKDIKGTTSDVGILARLYGGNPLALTLVAEPIRELFGGDVGAFLATGDAFFNGVNTLLHQQFARSTPLEQTILYWLAVERELVPFTTLLTNLGEAVQQRAVLVGLESLRRRMLIERSSERAAFTLQPVILEYVTDQLVSAVAEEIADRQPRLVQSHALIQATAKEYVRRSQERLIALPLLERLQIAYGSRQRVEQSLLALLRFWRDLPLTRQSYGPANTVNLLRLLRSNLRGVDLSGLALRGAYLQGVEMQGATLAGAMLRDTVFTETFDAIQAVAVSSDGEYWAAASRRGEVLVWAAGGLILRQAWRAHTDMIWTLNFSPDGRMLASGSWDCTVKVWDVATGALRWSGRHTSHVNSLAFAPDSRTLASGANDATVRLWDAADGTLIQTVAHPGPVSGSGVTWSPDGHQLATGDLEGCIRLWQIHEHEPATCVLTIAAHTKFVDGLAFAPDGRRLASASWDGTVKIWDAASGQLQQQPDGHTDRVGRVAWSPDGRTLASGGLDRTILLWDVEQQRYRAALLGHTDGVCGLTFTPDSRNLLSSGDGTLRVWDATSGQCIRVIEGYADYIYVVDWSPDGTQLVSGGMDGLVTIWDLVGGAAPRVLSGHSGAVCGVGWSPDGRWLASAEWENVIRLWDAASGSCRQVFQHPNDTGNFFYGLVWSPDGQRLASGTSRHSIQVFDVSSHQQRWIGQEFPTFVRHIAWSPDGTRLAGSGDDGYLYIWDAVAGTLLQRLVGHHSMVTSVAWSADGTRLASGGRSSEGGELFVWDVLRGERVASLGGHHGMVTAVTWGASDSELVSGGGDGMLRWWDVQRGVCVRTREAHQGTVQSLKPSPDGSRLASCGDDGAITLWDMHTGAYLQTVRRDRPYERLDITGVAGLTEVQKATLRALGAVEGSGDTGTSPTLCADVVGSSP